MSQSANHTSILNAALKYQEKGLPVIPLKPWDKKPYIAWKQYQERCATPEEIKTWWQKWPDAMIGIVTGKVSNLLVIDCDTPEAWAGLHDYLPDSSWTPIV
ncbi:MAG: bifunctional DNA primase/polymerase, partial [Syntrophales bacterium LBB04]|nr:bifunctional DNA primase/polymerase [Syntrophales bacterium LBB04]